jgi:type II secretory ATPase GspE/PulE/Tfp pilus assembly ATPase PilB-like protein
LITERELVEELAGERLIDESARNSLLNQSGTRSRISTLESCINQGLINRELALPVLKKKVSLLTPEDLVASDEALERVPYKYAAFYGLLPLQLEDGVLNCALANPFDTELRQEIETVLQMTIEPVWAFSADIQEALKRTYGLGADVEPMAETASRVESSSVGVAPTGDAAVRLVDSVLLDAVSKRATDIHIEPFEERVRLRYRVDGLLYQQNITSAFAANREAVIARLKVLANLNLAEKRRPQDGRIKLSLNDREFDLRISVLPTVYGETVDVRLLSESHMSSSLPELGFSEQDVTLVEKALERPHGMILVTGPTGSGKTTTLYNFLNRLNAVNRKVITIEDPIEYQLPGVTQLQVHPQIDFTFANGLRSMLRHDPDIMMVGEIRDSETAKIAVQVALTGHLVLTTLHTNDSISALTRLGDMGVEPYLLAATLECVIAQRLVRRICPSCKQEAKLNPPELDFPAYEGMGCAYCNRTGYLGRTGVFEIFDITQKAKEMIGKRESLAAIRKSALAAGMTTLTDAGTDKVRAGITTYTEVMRILQSVK